MKNVLDNWKLWLVMSLTLGLAPFVPEPHIIGKLRWILGGAEGMTGMDWFDVALHGTPWLLLSRALAVKMIARFKKPHNQLVIIVSASTLLFIGCHNQMAIPESNSETHHEEESWGYGSPGQWAELSSDFVQCAEGLHQSPIDIETYKTNTLATNLHFNYHRSAVDMVNNGHTVQAIPTESNTLQALGKIFFLRQIHFHDPSEHHIDGIIYPMEVHLVHSDTAGALTVVAIFVKEGPPNAYLQAIWETLPEEPGEESHPSQMVDMNGILPSLETVFHYQGSLTTPPCTEGVEWFIIAEPMTMSKDQIAHFQKIHPGNNRPVQLQNERHVDALN